MSQAADAPSALDRLQAREEIMQICYWYQGEGFGDRFTPAAVLPFLTLDRALVAAIFQALVADGTMEQFFGTYAFTAPGKRGAGRLFVETFTEFQTGTHGECTAGCCDGDEVCDHE